ncbi:diguanylate cyclase [Pseudooceanicola aestuarii]|uniref:GGDEF domain-containing response regulator n=1 Tax=Pseudooceanicola aestuarii TaxID=2697319 RepID=UPI0013D45A24|nr:diguanylate cyclase [Pseudooceanicola aestuarii]
MPGRILVLDPDLTSRITACATLTGAFYDVMAAASIAEASRTLADHDSAMVIATGTGDPSSACGALRAHPRLGQHLLVVDAPAPASTASCIAAGADDVIDLAADPEGALARIAALFRLRAQHGALQPVGAQPALPGLAEAPAMLVARGHVALVHQSEEAARDWLRTLAPHTSFRLRGLDLGTASACTGADLRGEIVVLALEPRSCDRALRLLAEMRTNPSTSETEILLIDDGAGPARVKEALALGATAATRAGFEVKELAARLAALQGIHARRVALRRALRDRLRASVTDPLTGLYNRRYAMPRLSEIAATSNCYTVIIADVDHFKSVNDRHGHQAGDAALIALSDHFRCRLRSGDLLARIGGEEFLLALPDTPLEDATQIARHLCKGVAARRFDVPGLALPLRLSVSAGVAEAQGTGRRPIGPHAIEEGPRAVLDLADRALYAAKARGRNRVETVPLTLPAQPAPRTAGLKAG